MPQDVIDFKDQVTLILNNGRYSAIVVGTAPSWVARNGEFVFFNSSNVTRTYFYNNGLWNYLETSVTGGPVSDVSNNLVTVSNNLATVQTTVTNGALKGWIYFSGTGSLSIDDSFNVASLTRHTTGQFSIAWTTTMANTFYAISGNARRAAAADYGGLLGMSLSSLLIGSSRLTFVNVSSVQEDPSISTVLMTGDQ